jgi:hypothetical protein
MKIAPCDSNVGLLVLRNRVATMSELEPTCLRPDELLADTLPLPRLACEEFLCKVGFRALAPSTR